jgi:hypothetical protein
MATGKSADRPDQDATNLTPKPRTKEPGTGSPRGAVQHGVADADVKARTGSEKETIRNTPPAGDFNEVTKD